MEESASNSILDGKITGIEFSLATRQEICISSNSDCPISHASQLSNPFLGLPLEVGKCESCGTAEPGKCEGHFGYIELPTPVYHPSHISELKRMLSLLCLKCLKLKNRKLKKVGLFDRALACCEEASQVRVDEDKLNKLDDTHAVFLVLKIPSKSAHDDSWDFLDRYGFRFCDVIPNRHKRRLLPSEAMVMLRKVPAETKKKLAAKGYFPQDGYIMQYLPVPPNCLSVPDVSDGISVMSSDLSLSVLRKVMKQVETIKGSRSGTPNFESSEIEANDLQVAIAQYLQVRGTAQASRDKDTRYGMRLEQKDSSTKAWLAKMKMLFIQKASGFSSRSVITGDPYRGVGEIGLPFEIAQRITFEERVNEYNLLYLQKLVDEKLCLSYRDGSSTYSLREGSKGHTFLRPGQVVQRRIMDGDIVFINRPPTTHKHSLQALKVYVHEDHTVKINPLICGPLSADFDGDCVHLFYPQSLAAKAEVLELFSVEKQLLSSHDGNFNLKMAADSLLSLKLMFKKYFFSKPAAQQLAVFVSNFLPEPALLKATNPAMIWTALQLLQTTLPSGFDYYSDNHLISKSQFLKVDFNRDVMPSIISDIVSSIFFGKGPDAVLSFFNSVQPMLMENLYSEGFSVGLEDFYIPKATLENIQTSIQDVSPLLSNLRSSYNELVELQLENYVKLLKTPATDFILKKSSMGDIIDSKSESAINRVFQQIGFLGFQISDKGKLYSKTLAGEMSALFHKKHPFSKNYRTEEFGFVSSCLFHGLDPYQEMVHSISSREVMVRSSRGLTEPGTLFKNLMAILRDVVVCYDGTVRNVCSHSVIQFEYGVQTGILQQDLFAAGEPVGVLAATAMSTPAYKAVLDSSPTSNSSWEMMKEILQCKVNFRNEPFDRRVILYLADCQCGRKYCRENAAYAVKNHLKKLSLKDAAIEILIEYKTQQMSYENSEIEADLVGHIHLDKTLLGDSNLSMEEVLEKCEETLISFRKNKKEGGYYFKKIKLAFSECCCFNQSIESKWLNAPCLKFYSSAKGERLENLTHLLADTISPVLLKTIIKGDPRVQSANIIWISPDTTTWIRNPSKTEKGELAVDVVLEEKAVKKSGDSWRIVVDTCLPVMHLIDATRSIPYGIKQVQQLLGISCAFEQSVQRLSMVTKGVLKDHLLLLGNSMTCSGNLIGFNSGGIKAVSKALNVQIPFTEATLFTPKRCFEKAAEKCYVDSLSSIVASCSWGKPVAVGTGSNFDILLDTKEVKLHEQEGTDVYNFLSLVQSVSEEETNPACLGVDTEDMEDEYMEAALSPEHGSSLGKPVFDDAAEFDIDFSKDSGSTWGAPDAGWGKQTTSSETGGWGKPAALLESGDAGWGKSSVVPESGDSGWGKKSAVPESGDSGWGTKSAVPESGDGGWGTKSDVPKSRDSGWGPKSAVPESGDAGIWGKKPSQAEGSFGKKAQEAAEPETWGKKTSQSSEGSWGKAPEATGGDTWGNKPSQASKGSWGKAPTAAADGDIWSKKPAQASDDSWGKAPAAAADGDIWSKKPAQAGDDSWGKAPAAAADGDIWSKKPAQAGDGSWGKAPVAASDDDIWGKEPAQASDDSWGKAPIAASDGDIWGKEPAQASDDNWGKASVAASDGDIWGKKTAPASDDIWGKAPIVASDGDTWGKKTAKASDDSWGKAPIAASDGDIWGTKPSQASEGSWGKKALNADDGDIWKKKAPGVSEETWGKKLAEASDGNDWGKKVPEAADGWGKKLPLEAADDGGWGKKASTGQEPSSPSTAAWGSAEPAKSSDPSEGAWGKKSAGEGVGGGSWGQKPQEASGGSWGSGNKRGDDSESGGGGWKRKEGWGGNEWKGKRDNNLPPGGRGRGRGGGRTNENYTPVPLTATRQRVDNFSTDEQEVISKVDSVIHTLRKILHQSGYNDGDPVSAEHQSFVVDNVFNYHPDKDAKIGSGIQHITVKEHGNFQGSRCFFVASTDGKIEDFSYMKCLENFVKVTYPENAESFVQKYFVKPQPRANWNRERGNNGAAADNTSSPRPGSAQESQEAGSEEAAVGSPSAS